MRGKGWGPDKEFLHYHTGLDPAYLHSCSVFYTASDTYHPTRDEILLLGSDLDWHYETEVGDFKLVEGTLQCNTSVHVS